MERKPIISHKELDVYKLAFDTSMRIFHLTKIWPKDERFSLIDQIRRSSRSVCANLAEAWRKRRYEGSFVVKLNDSESEAAETQTWLDFAVECAYLERTTADEMNRTYDRILGMLVTMINNPTPWLIHKK
jgi:four helix bundle protein